MKVVGNDGKVGVTKATMGQTSGDPPIEMSETPSSQQQTSPPDKNASTQTPPLPKEVAVSRTNTTESGTHFKFIPHRQKTPPSANHPVVRRQRTPRSNEHAAARRQHTPPSPNHTTGHRPRTSSSSSSTNGKSAGHAHRSQSGNRNNGNCNRRGSSGSQTNGRRQSTESSGNHANGRRQSITPSGNGHANAADQQTAPTNEQCKLYIGRWFMLGVVCILNMSNAMMWITFAAAADKTISFYGISSFQLNMLSMVFLIVMVPLGPAASWFLDTFGLKPALLLSAWLTAIGGLLRNISTMDIIAHDNKYTVLLIGQIVAACGQPLVMFSPTKLAAVWFPERKRALTNSIGSMMNPMGNLVAFVLVPIVAETEEDIPLTLWIVSGPAFFTVLMAMVVVRRSTPPSPPSLSAATKSEPFLVGVRKIMTNVDYIILNLCFGAGLALYTAMASFLEQILCPRGYSGFLAGMIGGGMVGCGCLMSALAAIVVDKSKMYDEVLKISYAIAVLAGILFTQVSRIRGQTVPVGLSTILFGMFGLVIYPISMELAVEITYPVAEATSSGLCIVSGQVQGIIYMFAMQYLAEPLPAWERGLETGCHIAEGNATAVFTPQDWTYSNLYILNVFSTAAVVVLILFFRPKYKRLIAEGVMFERQLYYDPHQKRKKTTNISTISTNDESSVVVQKYTQKPV